jgi:hypothetical protein
MRRPDLENHISGLDEGTTSKGLERRAAGMNSLPLCPDDIRRRSRK